MMSKNIDRDKLIAKLYTNKLIFEQFNEELMKSDNVVLLAYKLGEWKNTMIGTMNLLIKEIEALDD